VHDPAGNIANDRPCNQIDDEIHFLLLFMVGG
jgi:hypothetical protein